jgi:Ser/Thr protein kinase RdoA (MazF antagonist)
VLWNSAGPHLVDFDDMVVGPPVQDLWLLFSREDQDSRINFEAMLEAYEEFCPFDRASLKLIEGLRALRFIHFNTWIARRWQDPAFKRVFSDFNTPKYWQGQLSDLEEQLALVEKALV